MVFVGTLLHPSKGMALESLSIKFEVTTQKVVVGGKVAFKITVTDSWGNPYPVLAQEITTRFDGRSVVTIPQGMLQAFSSLIGTPPPALQSLLRIPPDQVNKTFFFFDPQKVDAFLKTHKDAVWLYTTAPLSESRRYTLEVEVNDGTASGSGSWSVTPSSSWLPGSPSGGVPASVSERLSPLSNRFAALSGSSAFLSSPTFPLRASPGALFPGNPDNDPRTLSTLAMPQSKHALSSPSLVAVQSVSQDCQAVSIQKRCLGGDAGKIDDTAIVWYGCGYYVTRSVPEGVAYPEGLAYILWKGFGPNPLPGGFADINFLYDPRGINPYQWADLPLVSFGFFSWSTWGPPGAWLDLEIERLTLLNEALINGWTFEICFAYAMREEPKIRVEISPVILHPSDLIYVRADLLWNPRREKIQDQLGGVIVFVENLPVGQSLKVKVEAESVERTGGHLHSGDRPAGIFLDPKTREPLGQSVFKTIQGERNPPGCEGQVKLGSCFALFYKPSPMSGEEKILVSAPGATTLSNAQFEVTLLGTVGRPGEPPTSILGAARAVYNNLEDPRFSLSPFTLDGNDSLVVCSESEKSCGSVNGHLHQIHFLPDTVRVDLWKAGLSFKGATGVKFLVKDCSLPIGGLFDLCNDWKPPCHLYHRIGNSVDIDGTGMTAQQIRLLDKIMKERNFVRVSESFRTLQYAWIGRQNVKVTLLP